MKSIDRIINLRPDDVSHADLVSAVLEVAAEVKQMKADIASGHAGAKITEIDPERIAKTIGQD